MADKEVQLKISADADQARTQIDAVGQATQALGERAQQAAPKINETGQAAQELGQHTQQAGTQAQQAAQKIDAVGKAAGDAAKQVGDIGAQAGGINQTEAATGRFATTTDWLRQKWQQTAGTVRDFAAGNLLVEVFKGIADRAVELARAFIEANNQITGLRRAFSAIYKDAGLAEQQIAFLRKTSNEAGVGFAGLSDSFKSFTASATAANIPLSVQNDLFASVAKAGATLGLSTVETSRAVLALSQMASKGVVSMEELRQQLGESLPGALSLAAKGLGLTEAELIKLVESGGLAARDLFPALAASLKSMAGENDTLTGTWERLKNAMAQAFTATGDGGGMTVLIAGAKMLAGAIGAVVLAVQGFAETLFGAGRIIGATAASIAILTDTSTTWAQKAAALKGVASDLSDSFAAAGGRIRATADAFDQATGAAEKTTTATTALKGAADQSSSAAAQLSQSWTSIGQVMNKAAADMALQVDNAQKHAEAVKNQSAALVELARVQGDQAVALAAESQAAQNNAAALEAVAQAHENELAILQGELTAKQNLIAGDEAQQKARAQELKDLSDKVAKLTEETKASREAAEAAKTLAVAKQAAFEADKDHSGQVDELNQKLAEQRLRLDEVRKAYAEGQAGREQVAEAERQVALAAAMVKDAYHDQVEAARAASIAAKGEAQAKISLLQTQKNLASQAEQMARLMGDESTARDMHIKQLQIDIQITLAKADAMRAEAQGSINVANAERAELEVKGPLTAVKKAELDATIKVAQAKLQEADATQKSADLIRQAITNINLYGSANRSAAQASSSATGQIQGHWQGVAQSVDTATKSLSNYAVAQSELGKGVKQMGGGFVNKDGMVSDAQGNVQQQFSWTRASIIDYLKQAGLDDLLAQDLAKQFLDANGNVVHTNNTAQKRWGGDMSTMAGALGKMVDYYKYGGGQHEAAERSAYLQGAQRQGATATAGGATYVSNITIDGKSTSVRFADRESQSAAESLLREVSNARRRAA